MVGQEGSRRQWTGLEDSSADPVWVVRGLSIMGGDGLPENYRAAAVNRAELQQLAEERIRDAKALLDARRWSAAYYLAGYAVECGLKACVLARVATAAEVIFEDRRFSEKCWTHSVEDLVKLAGLEAARVADVAADRVLRGNWLIVKDWSENSRYQRTSHQTAKSLYRAITNRTHGVMQWIKARW
jgi:hypothetical protein